MIMTSPTCLRACATLPHVAPSAASVVPACHCRAFEGSIGLTAYFTPHPPSDATGAHGAAGSHHSHTAAASAPRKVKVLRARLLDDVDASGSGSGGAASQVDDFLALCARRQLQPGAIVYLKRHRALALVTAAPSTAGAGAAASVSAAGAPRVYDGVWLDEVHEEFKKAVSGETFANGYHITDATHHALVDPPPVVETAVVGSGATPAGAAAAGAGVSGTVPPAAVGASSSR